MTAGSGVPVLGWLGAYMDMKHYVNCDYWSGRSHDLVDYIRRESEYPDRAFLRHTFGTL